MKKTILSFLALIMLTSVSFANCSSCDEKNYKKPDCKCNQQELDKPCEKKPCESCPVEDDEYCVYNQCFFDKRFRKLKQKLCLSKKQESMADNLYKTYKADMECICAKYRTQKNKVLMMIECHNQSWKDEKKHLKEIKKEAKERSLEFRDDLKEILCKNQYKEMKKYCRNQKKKMKRLIKYGAIYKLPCESCDSCGK